MLATNIKIPRKSLGLSLLPASVTSAIAQKRVTNIGRVITMNLNIVVFFAVQDKVNKKIHIPEVFKFFKFQIVIIILSKIDSSNKLK